MSSTTTAHTAPRHAPTTLREAWIALAGLAAVFLFEMLDNSILTVALPTIGRDLHASATALQWVTGVYAVVFGGLMLLFGAIADRVGRRRVMLIGLVLLALASLGTAFVATSGELIAVRAVMGVAAAMTTPGSIALAFRLFGEDGLRARAISIISTVGIVGLAIAPTVAGLTLAVAPWQVLLLVNVPVAALAFAGIRVGIPADDANELHRDPLDVPGALLGTLAVVLALVTPTAFVDAGAGSWMPWATLAGAVAAAVLFVVRERKARHPLLDLALVARPLVSSGLLYKAATGLALAGLSYTVTLQLQLDWDWSPTWAAIGMLPQVVVLLGLSPVVGRVIDRLGFDATAWLSAASVVAGLAVYGLLHSLGYPFVALALVLVAAGIRFNGVVAGTNVMRGLPANRSSIGAALVDTAQEIATGVGIAVSGTIVASLVAGSLTATPWSTAQHSGFERGVTIGALVLTAASAALVVWGYGRSRANREDGVTSVEEKQP